MVSSSQKFRLGLFILISSTVMVVFFVYVAGNRLFKEKDNYYIRFTDSSVSGLQLGSTVKYHGIAIGTVDEIAIDPEDVRSIILTISVKKGSALKSDIRATLAPVGITGLIQIELVGGTNEAANLNGGDFIERGSSTIENITGQAELITEKLELVLSNIINLTDDKNRYAFNDILNNVKAMSGDKNQEAIYTILKNMEELSDPNIKAKLETFLSDLNELTGKENRAKAEQVLDNLNILLDENKHRIAQILDNLDTASVHIASFTIKSEALVDKLSEQVDINTKSVQSTIKNFNTFSENISEIDVLAMVKDINAMVEQINTTFNHVDLTILRSRQDILVSISTLKETIDYLNEFSRLISDDPSVLIRQKNR